MVGSLRWGIAGALILPQAIILGGTFPLVNEDQAGAALASIRHDHGPTSPSTHSVAHPRP